PRLHDGARPHEGHSPQSVGQAVQVSLEAHTPSPQTAGGLAASWGAIVAQAQVEKTPVASHVSVPSAPPEQVHGAVMPGSQPCAPVGDASSPPSASPTATPPYPATSAPVPHAATRTPNDPTMYATARLMSTSAHSIACGKLL